jgi:hypothetical protein
MGFGGFGGDNCCIWIILIIVLITQENNTALKALRRKAFSLPIFW